MGITRLLRELRRDPANSRKGRKEFISLKCGGERDLRKQINGIGWGREKCRALNHSQSCEVSGSPSSLTDPYLTGSLCNSFVLVSCLSSRILPEIPDCLMLLMHAGISSLFTPSCADCSCSPVPLNFASLQSSPSPHHTPGSSHCERNILQLIPHLCFPCILQEINKATIKPNQVMWASCAPESIFHGLKTHKTY